MKADVHKHNAVEHANEHLDSALAKLEVKGEVILTDSERKALQARIAAKRTRPRGRPHLDTTGVVRKFKIAIDCYNRHHNGASVNDAVAATAAAFGISVAKVRKERQMFKRRVLS